jgi:heptaprenyl diphosphate synthase
MTSGADEESIEAISDWAWEMGLVFQMTDDVLDLVADEEFLGKPAGSDIREGVYTLPVLYAANGPDGDEIRALLGSKAPTDQGEIDRVIGLTVSGGHVDRVVDEAVERIRVAEKAADRIASEEVRAILEKLDAYLLERVRQARSS